MKRMMPYSAMMWSEGMEKAVRALQVSLHGQPVGEIEKRGAFHRFYFYDDYIENGERSVLGLQFEQDVRGTWTGQGSVPAWFANLLPEGSLHRMVDAELERTLGSKPTSVDLLARLGADLPGAVTVEEIAEPVGRSRRPFIEVAAGPPSAQSATVDGLRFSVAGVGMKFSLLREADKFVAPAVGGTGDWIVKLPDPAFELLPENEFACMQFAKSVGLEVPEVKLVGASDIRGVPSHLWHGEEKAFAIRRFDRTSQGRVHIEDLAQAIGYPVDDRYKGSFATVGAFVWRRSHDADLIEFVRRLVFNFLIGNDDAHLKNWSLIYEDRRNARLAPAYDLASVEVYGRAGLMRGTGLRIGSSRMYRDLNMESFVRLGRKIGFASDLTEIVRDVVERVSFGWDAFMETFPGELGRERVSTHFQQIRLQLLK